MGLEDVKKKVTGWILLPNIYLLDMKRNDE